MISSLVLKLEKGRFQCIVGVANIHKGFTVLEELGDIKDEYVSP